MTNLVGVDPVVVNGGMGRLDADVPQDVVEAFDDELGSML
jgi:hypothetical protein